MYAIEAGKAEAGLPALVAPLDPLLEADLTWLAVADELHVPAPQAPALPARWIGAALVRMEARALLAEQARPEP